MEETEEVEASIMKELGMPCFIKASRSGSSVGCYRCDKVEDLLPKLEEAAKYDNHVVVEECVDCIELETAVLEMMTLSYPESDRSCHTVNSIPLNPI